ncbi:Zinc finger protein CONSTANS-LIKE 8 [Hordeum vulgare]|uniref:Predicted protein n=1 Tax=Hordeum vulgare subsp. vulgare TaxID=112509 RepID=F2DBP3_HORVV|nr:Zinc finger protein CONSTANS-LIKE 8 [Hordeum vulgare]KAI4972549.1 hypothetical protein ZWY2020_003474 [Hordeum vulgare]BAJ92514.1 predicted protein [Hordeum vulgare subsp. vulgare]BAJ94275.1 predicted protein [Hordeum vulgare subsp. vulgare]BAK01784.1 predicted protein [Hordeum vulgare subsp. vulgare]
MASGGGGGRRRGSRRAKVKKKKKTKYLSLSRHLAKAVEVDRPAESLSAEDSLPPPSALASPSTEEAVEDGCGHEQQQQQQQQLEPFALHPEAPSTLFAAAPSLTDILGLSSSSFSGGGEGDSPSCTPSPDASAGTAGGEEDLARRALRGRERWVYCRSSSSSPSAATATTTTSSSCSSAASTGAASARSPLLKLDYDEILAAWAGRGSLYIGGAAGHVTPKLELGSEVFVDVAPPRQAATWSSPEVSGRAERVRRYKEKRHARLFSKRIRYEVRRLNAVKRPRLKGRFIKDKEGVAMAN